MKLSGALKLRSTVLLSFTSDLSCGSLWISVESGDAARQALQSDTGVAVQHVPAGCHQSNGLVGRFNETLMNMVRTMLRGGNLSVQLLGELVLYTVHIYNISPHQYLIQNPLEEANVPHLAYMHDMLP